jgi:4-aminobutyrate aminotransferase/(S)-3-amino-2-methylpropionate transaminase
MAEKVSRHDPAHHRDPGSAAGRCRARDAATPRGATRLTPIAVARAEGAVVEDVDGNRLLDFAGGIGALALGHCPPRVVEAVKAQADRLLHACAIVASYEPTSRSPSG